MNAAYVTRLLLVFLVVVGLCPGLANAGAAEEAEDAFSRFFPAFAAYNQAQAAQMFAPEAQFYGTLSPDLVSTPDGVLKYFTASLDRPDLAVATPVRLTSRALSESIVLIAGSWKLDRTLNGKATSAAFRMTAVMQKQGDRWLVVQFHNSLLPAPTSAQPAASR